MRRNWIFFKDRFIENNLLFAHHQFCLVPSALLPVQVIVTVVTVLINIDAIDHHPLLLDGFIGKIESTRWFNFLTDAAFSNFK